MTTTRDDLAARVWLDAGMQPWRVWTIEMSDLPEYVLATPEALSAHPAVRALVEAERERCARECDKTAREADMFGDSHGRQVSERTAAAIRKGETP